MKYLKKIHPDKKDINNYVKWLEMNSSSIIRWIKRMFVHAEKREWFETYWAIDIHGTVSIPDYRKTSKEIEYYPYAKESLQIMTQRKDIIMIMSTSSYPEEIKTYIKQFDKDNIHFNYINENPDISTNKGSYGFYEKKFYFNVNLDDKAGFDPEIDWELIYNYLSTTKYKPNPKWKMKYKEIYHK